MGIEQNAFESHFQCPKGHYDKTLLKRVGNMSYWECNVCRLKFWVQDENSIKKNR